MFSVRTTLTGQPVFEFDASSIDAKYKETITLKETASLFVFSWIYVAVIILLLALIIKIIVPKKKTTPVVSA